MTLVSSLRHDVQVVPPRRASAWQRQRGGASIRRLASAGIAKQLQCRVWADRQLHGRVPAAVGSIVVRHGHGSPQAVELHWRLAPTSYAHCSPVVAAMTQWQVVGRPRRVC